MDGLLIPIFSLGLAAAAPQASPVPAPAPARGTARLGELNAELQALVARVTPSVVQILVTSYGATASSGTGVALTTQRASGSGAVIDALGQSGIPFTAVYPPTSDKPLTLASIYTKDTLLATVDKAK